MAGKIYFAYRHSPVHKVIFSVGFGFLVGFVIALFLSGVSQFLSFSSDSHTYKLHPHLEKDDHDNPEETVILQQVHHEHENDNTTIQKKLYDEVRILCWVMTNPKNHKTKAKHVLNTWGKRCNKLLFMSSETDDELDVVALPVEEGRNSLWAKTKEAFKYIYQNHLDDADWFLKADDDTYVIVENLRYTVHSYPPDYPIYFGCRFKPHVKQGYMSGGAGYLLSKEAVVRFVEEAIPDSKICRRDNGGAEDAEIGECLQNIHVLAGDSRDTELRWRFFPFEPEGHLIADPNHNWWYWEYIYYPLKEGPECCSDTAVTFHYIYPKQMYVIDYLVYHVRVFGRIAHQEPLHTKKLNFMQMNEKFREK